jgi:endonuclease/exonuclease/phosphatase (EEP) superfamily protein YafD
VASTHLEALEIPALPQLQLAQADQLLAALANQPVPVVLLGDFNSAADGSTTPTYAAVQAAGYLDSWLSRHGQEPGFTCCQQADLRNARSQLSQRIDFVFWREAPAPAPSAARLVAGPVDDELVGADPGARTAAGLWPSDHAGVHAVLPLEPPRGLGLEISKGR